MLAQSALSLLVAVISKRAQVPELYDIVGPVTDLMLNYALGRKALRQKCVVVLTRFLTEVPMTRDKFRSHVDLYLRSLRAYPDPGGRLALCELLEALVFRLPSPVLADEAMVLFVPFAEIVSGSAAGSEHNTPEVRRRAAAVLVTLITNAGLHVFAPAIQQWCRPGAGAAVRTTGMLLLPLFAAAACAAAQFWFVDAAHLLALVDARANLWQAAAEEEATVVGARVGGADCRRRAA